MTCKNSCNNGYMFIAYTSHDQGSETKLGVYLEPFYALIRAYFFVKNAVYMEYAWVSKVKLNVDLEDFAVDTTETIMSFTNYKSNYRILPNRELRDNEIYVKGKWNGK